MLALNGVKVDFYCTVLHSEIYCLYESLRDMPAGKLSQSTIALLMCCNISLEILTNLRNKQQNSCCNPPPSPFRQIPNNQSIIFKRLDLSIFRLGCLARVQLLPFAPEAAEEDQGPHLQTQLTELGLRMTTRLHIQGPLN